MRLAKTWMSTGTNGRAIARNWRRKLPCSRWSHVTLYWRKKQRTEKVLGKYSEPLSLLKEVGWKYGWTWVRIGIGRLAVPPQLNLRIDRRLTNHVFFPYIKIPVVIVTGRGSTCEVYFHLKGAHRNPCLCSLISNGVSMCQSKGIPLSEFLENRQQFRNSHIVSKVPTTTYTWNLRGRSRSHRWFCWGDRLLLCERCWSSVPSDSCACALCHDTLHLRPSYRERWESCATPGEDREWLGVSKRISTYLKVGI